MDDLGRAPVGRTDEQIQTDTPLSPQSPDIVGSYPPLPLWLTRRLLRRDEKVTWVRGPRFNPSWERYVTNPLLFLLAMAIGAACVGATWLINKEWCGMMLLAAGGLLLVTIFILGIFSGYFTRLVVTNYRLVIMQGYEVVRSWSIHALPRRLIRYGIPGGPGGNQSIDLDAVKRMLGSSSDKVTAKAILSFGKQLDQIMAREKDRS
jgi:hypothetical protein